MTSRLYRLTITATWLLSALPGLAGWTWQDARVPDLGFDLDAAQILRVASLEGKGDGSLREALEHEGPRIIVFEIAGVIDLDKRALRIVHPEVIVAGQTAPAPGITIIRGGLGIRADRVLVQHLRIRPGDAGEAKRSGWAPDGIATTGGPEDVWIDHCSVTWSVDENLSPTSYQPDDGLPGRRIHVRHCLIAEALNDSSHAEAPHSKGSLVFGGTQEVAIVGNLYASNVERNPLFQPDTSGVIVNNVIANPGQRSIHGGTPADATTPKPRLAVVGNVVLFGPDTKKSSAVFEGAADGFFDKNAGFDRNAHPIPELRKPFPTLNEPPLWPEGLEALDPIAAVWQVAHSAGARPAERDAIDRRIVEQALAGTSRIIDSQDEVGGYPKIEPVRRPLDVPEENRRRWLDDLARDVETRE